MGSATSRRRRRRSCHRSATSTAAIACSRWTRRTTRSTAPRPSCWARYGSNPTFSRIVGLHRAAQRPLDASPPACRHCFGLCRRREPLHRHAALAAGVRPPRADPGSLLGGRRLVKNGRESRRRSRSTSTRNSPRTFCPSLRPATLGASTARSSLPRRVPLPRSIPPRPCPTPRTTRPSPAAGMLYGPPRRPRTRPVVSREDESHPLFALAMPRRESFVGRNGVGVPGPVPGRPPDYRRTIRISRSTSRPRSTSGILS